jgi:sporulation protein YlmC with PRC-barrel domain
MKKHLIIIFVAIVGLFLGMNGFTQEKRGPEIRAAEGQRINAFMVEKIMGSKVINMKGETLGKIKDLVVDIDTGTILYALLDAGSKLSPVPWVSLAALPSEGIFFLDQSKEQMSKAPAFDKKNLPNLEEMQWGLGILKYYGVPGNEQQRRMDYYYGYGGYYEGYPGRVSEAPLRQPFDSKTIKTISGQVIKVDRVSDPGFGMQMGLTLFIGAKEIMPVYLGPVFYIEGPEQPKAFKAGDKVIVIGSQVTVRGGPFMIAMTVKRGNEVLRLRDKDGTPEWVGWKKTSD